MSCAANELMWFKQLCTDLSITAKKPTLWGDNKSANLLPVTPISGDRSKHIGVRHLRVREYVEHDEMDVHVITRRQGTHAWCMGCRWFRCDNACGLILLRCVSED